MSGASLWQRYKQHLCVNPSIGLTLDISRMDFEDGFFDSMADATKKAYAAMDALEAGEIANPDENRMVGHYWLRDPAKAPSSEIRSAIELALADIKKFVADVHSAAVKPASAPRFTDVLVIGIGGSALGPQLAAEALGEPTKDQLKPHFFDNTDPDGAARTLRAIGDNLKSTLAIVISKSGGTPETRNGMLMARQAYEAAGLTLAQHAVAVTGDGSKLDKVAESEGWLARFPMWDWVGGRTSELATVGLLPAALQGLDIGAMLKGAAACDVVTRMHDTPNNPAMLLALMWHHGTNGKGEKDMVVLPYKDRLLLFSRYLQQLVMESLGKEQDLDGNEVHQGIAVYGNKGSTDQHAYVQQLREGVNNFFAVFIRVLEDGGGDSGTIEVDEGVTPGDYLDGFWQGTRRALYENGRGSMTLTIPRADAFHLGMLIALFERAVGFYATMVNINAYHQPGVEAGKKAAAAVLDVQAKVVAQLFSGGTQTVEQVAEAIGMPDEIETVYHVLEHMVANGRANAARGEGVFDADYAL